MLPDRAVATPSEANVLRLRYRHDVVVECVNARGEACWHLKDPLTLRYWQFGAEELFLWRQLDGSVTLHDWQNRFHQRFAPRHIERARLLEFLGMLHREGLVVADGRGQSSVLLERRAEQQWNEWFLRVSNPLAIRFRGIDPEPWLTRLYPWVAWLFHPLSAVMSILLMCSAVLLVLTEWQRFALRLPEAGDFLSPGNLIVMAVALAVTKILHELGHALVCKHVGGECHELGFMLLLLTPCLYCNVSDIWLVPDKWRRMAVSAAGMWVELVLAACATWLWWFSAPGAFHNVCLTVMVVCSVGTVLVNGNPLLRYDGYFLLSDWLEIPNLRTEAAARLRGWFMAAGLGRTDDSRVRTRGPRAPGWLGTYAVLSLAYRLSLTAIILWLFHRWLAVVRLESLSYVCIPAILVGLVAPGLRAGWNDWRKPGRSRLRFGRLAGVSLVAALLAGVLLCIPLPRSMEGAATLRPAESQAVYISVPGILLESAKPGVAVRQGDALLTLRNSDLECEIARLAGEAATWRVQLESLRRQQVQDTRAGVGGTSGQVRLAEQALADVERQLEHHLAEREKLVVRAPADGVLVSPPARRSDVHEMTLAGWSGDPLAPQNRGCFLEAGALVAYVGQHHHEALVFVSQDRVSPVRVGQRVRLQLDEVSGRTWEGQVAAVGQVNSVEIPAELVARHRLPSPAPSGTNIPNQFHPVRVTLDDHLTVPYGSTGRARIQVDRESLVRRMYVAFRQTFRLAGR